MGDPGASRVNGPEASDAAEVGWMPMGIGIPVAGSMMGIIVVGSIAKAGS